MSHWQQIRTFARKLRHDVLTGAGLSPSEAVSTEKLNEFAARFLDLELIPEHPESNNLAKALAVLEDDVIFFDNSLGEARRAFCIAHEIGHFRLHHRSVHCSGDEIDEFAAESDSGSAIEKIVGYGAGERREREANIFALEFLLPGDLLKELFLKGGKRAHEIAETFAMPLEMVAGQIARSVLVPEIPAENAAENPAKTITLDESQRRAAFEAVCPALISAGPGTGKTRTLTSRIEYLIENGTAPDRILAMTFSNKAAEEMRDRIAVSDENAAAAIQVMTFHAFGLDLLRRYWKEAGLDPHSGLIDRFSALEFLESRLNDLQLNHYLKLYDPLEPLGGFLGAISRAKDELCSPAEYRSFGEKMLERALAESDEEAANKAEKILEAARVYEIYQKHLDTEKMLDFGDLIFRSVRLLRENETVKREVQRRFDAILVDEFQDVNRACGVLLKEIAGDGKNLWAVGDLRQSIYRWRGASPANISLFDQDFPNAATLSLETNYRSRAEIVNLFSRFAEDMKAGGARFFKNWTPAREAEKDGSSVRLTVAEFPANEGAWIAEEILRCNENGSDFGDCAVICRSHGLLSEFAVHLAKAGVPVFYIGELFERECVRDMLCLLELLVSREGHSLMRVASFPEYDIAPADRLKLVARQKELDQTLNEILSEPQTFEMLSADGARGARRLREHIEHFNGKETAWGFLSRYLFSDSRRLDSLFAAESVENITERIALYQFLRLVQDCETRFRDAENPVSAFLSHVKKLTDLGEVRDLAQIPDEVKSLDAVKLLTIHGSKGLEFPIVFLPRLAAGSFPGGKNSEDHPNPEGMIDGEEAFHEEESECLFFVAMSRARDRLFLSRPARQTGGKNSNPSVFLTRLEDALPEPEFVETASEPVIAEEFAAAAEAAKHLFYSSELDDYLTCPLRYCYSHLHGLKSDDRRSVYQKFHGATYKTIRKIAAGRELESGAPDADSAREMLDREWSEAEIDAHPFSEIYLEKAREIVARAVRRLGESIDAEVAADSWFEIPLENAVVRVRGDLLEIRSDGERKQAVVQNWKTGKAAKKAVIKDREVMQLIGAQNKFPEYEAAVEHVYFGDDSAVPLKITPTLIANRTDRYRKAVEGINAQRFDPKTGSHCKTCPHYFYCPSV